MRVSVGGKIFFGVVLIQVISAALILGWFFYSVKSELNELTQQNAQETVLRSVTVTEEYFGPTETAVQSVQRLLASGVLNLDRPDQLGRYFFEQLRAEKQLAGLFVGYPDGSFFYVMPSDKETTGGTRTKVIRNGPTGREVLLTWHDSDYAAVKETRDPADTYDPRERPWYRAAAKQDGVVWTKPYVFFTSRKPGITAAISVPDGDGKLAAVVGIDIEMSEVSRFLRQIVFNKGGSAFIVAPEGEVIAHSSVDLVLPDSTASDDSLRFRKVAELDGIAEPVRDRILARLSGNAGATAPRVWEETSGEQGNFVAMARMSNTNWPWQIIAIVPAKGMTEVASGSNLILVGVTLLATALACTLGYALSQSIGQPLATLGYNAKLARGGNIELMDDLSTGYTEISDTDDTLRELAQFRRQHGAPRKAETTGDNSEGRGQKEP